MTSTSIYTGMIGERATSRVLKPPGGGTSDLFANPPDQADSPRKARNQSSLTLGDPSPIAENDAPSFKPGNDSHNRLFGAPDAYQARKNNPQNCSSIMFGRDEKYANFNGEEKIAEITNVTVNNTNASGDIPKEVVDGATDAGGNPVTGEGYESPKSNGSQTQINGSPPNGQVPIRNRVPPGGFSSGLW